MKNSTFLIAIFLLFGSAAHAQKENDTEWDDYFMPGVGYKVYTPKNIDSLGIYQGIMTEFVIYARARTGDSWRSGPARVKTYGNLSIMKSDVDGARDMFNVNVGVNLSFEAVTKRKFAIPYFGLELGGLFQRDFSSLQFTPVAGLQLLSTRRVIWTAQAGYNYTLKYFDEYSGMQYSSTVNLLLWNN
ncbi:MAG TPA: hypothetical protein VK151_08490 [Fluviicola sp.]|nr:hypothetical protein [Fluviicola sp.]